MTENTSRLVKIGDALSQLLNVLLLPKHRETTANESISGRAYRQGWKRTERAINWLFSLIEKDHCRVSHETDIARSKQFVSDSEKP